MSAERPSATPKVEAAPPAPEPFFARLLQAVPRTRSGLRAGRRN